MNITKLRDAWERWGKVDPMWAVLTAPDMTDRRWDPEEFFLTGEREIAEVLDHLQRLAIELRLGSALDFGCGVGRLTQALSKHFERVIGVDIAPSMLAKARELGRAGPRIEFVLNQEDNLRVFEAGSFDFVYSNLTLQHMPPSLARVYLAEFARVLKGGGCLAFQLPSGRRRQPVAWKRLVRKVVPTPIIDGVVRWKVRRAAVERGLPVMEVYSVPKRDMVDFLHDRGLRVVVAEEREEVGSVWLSCWYFVTKPEVPLSSPTRSA